MLRSAARLCAAGALAVATSGSQGRHRSSEFGLSVDVPAGAATCPPHPQLGDAGVTFYLDGGKSSCYADALERRPNIEVYAAYGDWDLQAALGERCSPRQGSSYAVAPDGLSIAGRRSSSCRVDADDHTSVAIVVVTEAVTGDGLSAIDYTVELHTTPQRLAGDLERFRKLLGDGIAVNPPVSEPRHYRNDEFGFSVQLPRGAATCRGSLGEHDHGIDFYLDGGRNGCIGLEARPYISAGGFYNAADAPTAEAALGELCTQRGSRRSESPHGLAIAGLHSAACRASSADGRWIDLFIAAQSPHGREVAAINYVASLHTMPDRFPRDLDRFRTFLASGMRVDQAR
jgi:hypothetical protein